MALALQTVARLTHSKLSAKRLGQPLMKHLKAVQNLLRPLQLRRPLSQLPPMNWVFPLKFLGL
jgi:hypothetical protein